MQNFKRLIHQKPKGLTNKLTAANETQREAIVEIGTTFMHLETREDFVGLYYATLSTELEKFPGLGSLLIL